MTLCFYCNHPIGENSWYHKDIHLGYAVKICEECHREFDRKRSEQKVDELRKLIRKAYEMCHSEIGMTEDEDVRIKLGYVLNHLGQSKTILKD